MADVALKKIPELQGLSVSDLNTDDLLVIHHANQPYKTTVGALLEKVKLSMPRVTGVLSVRWSGNDWSITKATGFFEGIVKDSGIAYDNTAGQYTVTLKGLPVKVGRELIWGNGGSRDNVSASYVSCDFSNSPPDTLVPLFKVRTLANAGGANVPFDLMCLSI